MDSLSRRIPRGMGKGAVWSLGSADELADLMRNGAAYAVAHGFESDADLARCEGGGAMPGAEPDAVSERAAGAAPGGQPRVRQSLPGGSGR